MTKHIRVTCAPFLVLALLAAACGGDAADDTREIELAPTTADADLSDTAATTAEPEPEQAPVTKAPAPRPQPNTPARTEPRPEREPARATSGVIAQGTSFTVTNGARICTNTHKVGDRFTATVTQDVTGSNGATIPAGATVTLAVTESQMSKNSKSNWKLAFDVVSVTLGGETLDVAGDVTKIDSIEVVRSQGTGQQAGKVATGAAIGAIAGQILGKDTKSTVIGGAIGAAAGGAVAAGTADYEGCVPANGSITFALAEPLTVRVASSN